MAIPDSLCEHKAQILLDAAASALMHKELDINVISHELDEVKNALTLARHERDELQAELDGMAAGARLNSPEDTDRWDFKPSEYINAARQLSIDMDAWIDDIIDRVNSVRRLNDINGETVKAHLEPFINIVHNWKTRIDAIINPESIQEDN